MVKKILACFLAAFLCISAFSVCAFAEQEEGSPKHVPRIVSVVFDDSGSMYKNTDRWAYTSYAMQAFTAMMGREDVLYVTYLNGASTYQKVSLLDGEKSTAVNGFSEIVFGGGTPNKMAVGAQCLEKEFASYKDNAKYYLVVMADGELDASQGILADELRAIAAQTKVKLSGAEYETIYFSMKDEDKTEIDGVTSHFSSDSTTIVNVLKNISADIMGRTTLQHTVSGDQLSFSLPYPALSIAVFLQKINGDFSDFQTSVRLNGKELGCQLGNYPVKCPTEIIKNENTTMFDEKIPEDPPSGVVSLISNAGAPLSKGSYTVDLSNYSLTADNIVVLVEPAVRIGCKYYINDWETPVEFNKLTELAREGDTVSVECGLYEMNADGSLGEAVPRDVLSPTYKLLIGGNEINTNETSRDNTYSFQLTKEFENKELRVEARLKGYQPFVQKEQFGKLRINIKPLLGGSDSVTVTKPQWKQWSEGKQGIRFELEELDSAVFSGLSIEVEGCDGLPAGACSQLEGSVRMEGNAVVYSPKSAVTFAQLPKSFSVELKELDTGNTVLVKTVTPIQPAYRFSTQNELADTALSLELLKNNTLGVEFVLEADYEGNGQFVPLSKSDCEEQIPMILDAGTLPGETTEENGMCRFVPKYDQAAGDRISPEELLGKEHSLRATATVDGQQIVSDPVSLFVNSAAYRLEVENEITQPLLLDGIKKNESRIIFRLLADYEGNGTFGPLASWDRAAVDRLQIDAGSLPGKVETSYDEGGQPLGKVFIPRYDESNNNGIPFTAVAGKVHSIVGTVTQSDTTAQTTVEVLAPNYEIIVRQEGVNLVNTELRGNQEGVAFTVLRDGRALSAEELSAMAPYQLTFDVEQRHLNIATRVQTAEDGTAYLLCMPQADCWGWLGFFLIRSGDMHIVLTLGNNSAAAGLSISVSKVGIIVLLVTLGVLAVVAWMLFCAATTVRFTKGSFCKVVFNLNKNGKYVISDVLWFNPNQSGMKTKIRWMMSANNLASLVIPFKQKRYAMTIFNETAAFIAKKPISRKMFYRTFPESIGAVNKGHVRTGKVTWSQLVAIAREDRSIEFSPDKMQGKPHTELNEAMHDGQFLTEENSKTVLLYLTKREMRDLAPK